MAGDQAGDYVQSVSQAVQAWNFESVLRSSLCEPQATSRRKKPLIAGFTENRAHRRVCDFSAGSHKKPPPCESPPENLYGKWWHCELSAAQARLRRSTGFDGARISVGFFWSSNIVAETQDSGLYRALLSGTQSNSAFSG